MSVNNLHNHLSADVVCPCCKKTGIYFFTRRMACNFTFTNELRCDCGFSMKKEEPLYKAVGHEDLTQLELMKVLMVYNTMESLKEELKEKSIEYEETINKLKVHYEAKIDMLKELIKENTNE